MVCINKVVAGSTKQHPKADNRDILLEYQAQQALLNVEQKCVVWFSCNCEVRTSHKARHERTLKHLNHLKHIDVRTETPDTTKQDQMK